MSNPSFDPWPQQEVQLSRGAVSVRSAGALDGEPAVLVHGLGGSALNWTDLMGLLADQVASQAPDLPGFGHSPPPSDGDYSIAASARTVVELIEATGRGPVHLLGNSLGGAVSTLVAASRPDLIRTLTLISPALPDFRPSKIRSQAVLLAVPGLGPRLATRVGAMSAEARVDGLLGVIYADPSAVSAARRAEAVAEVERRSTLAHTNDALAQSTRALISAHLAGRGSDLWVQAGRITAPTLLLYGSQDKLVLGSISGKAGKAFPNSRVVVLPQTGHVAQMEHPDLVARFFRAFCQTYGKSLLL